MYFPKQKKNVSDLKEGATLTKDDVVFLTMVSKATLDESRGAANIEANIAGKTFKPGQKLTQADAFLISGAIQYFQKDNKDSQAPSASRGAGWCYYWYKYCDWYGYCYWYKYWYWCY